MSTRFCVVVGTRPEIIKMSPVIRELDRLGSNYFILHTGQHYSYKMDYIFFQDLLLPKPKYNLEVGSGLQGEQTGKILTRSEQILKEEKPDIVLVQGDTNTVLGVALAASKLGLTIGHVEAGLRCYTKGMPEELNRILVDHISDLLFAPTQNAVRNLNKEGIIRNVFCTGNTIVDAVKQNLVISQFNSKILQDLKLKKDEYILATIHRQENVDNFCNLKEIIDGFKRVGIKTGLLVIFVVHPRTRKMLQEKNIDTDGILLLEPVGYIDFLSLEASSRLILTDSGGVQEEACILHVPCVTVRQSTERPETVEVGANTIAGIDSSKIEIAAQKMMSSERNWKNPFGDGNSAKRIVHTCLKTL
ncbi:MAG: UDP-N-acetylglucosamine 2-epimerase (non-hydrolyzing) [Methanomassiliicoccales archaeon]